MLVVTVASVLCLGTLIVVREFGWRFYGISALLFSVCLFPLAFLQSSILGHVGIAGPAPEVRTFTIVICLIVLCVLARLKFRLFHPAHVLFLMWVFIGVGWFWPNTQEMWAGAVQLVLGVLAWTSGRGLYLRSNDRNSWVLTLLLASIVGIQVVVTALQVAGVQINALDVADASILGNRANGTANHPNNLGKMLLLLLVLLLPMTAAISSRTRSLATFSCVMMFVPLALAQGRANFLAVLMALAIWSLFSSGGRNVGGRLLFMSSTVVAVVGSAAVFLSRFDEDPTGGVRPEIMRIAMLSLRENLDRGVGPNLYVTEVSSREGSYIPVHNTLVLLISETGLIGAVLFLAPALFLVARSFRLARVNDHARAVVAVSPGLAVVGWTGWGLLGTSILPLWFFVFGFALSAIRDTESGFAAPTASESGPSDKRQNGQAKVARRSRQIQPNL